MDLSSDDLVAALQAELARVHGKDYAGKCILFRRGSWIYFSTPRQISRNQYAADPFTQPLQRGQIEALLEELKGMESKKRFRWF